MILKTFIPLECDVFNDNRMSALINHAGTAGYGTYMILLVELRSRENYRMNAESLKMIARKYNIRRKLMDDVLYNYGLFTVESMSDGDILISSEYVTRVMRNYDEKVARRGSGVKKIPDNTSAVESERPLNSVATTEQNITEHNITEEKEKEKEKTAVAAVPEDSLVVSSEPNLQRQKILLMSIYPAQHPCGQMLFSTAPPCYIALPLPAI